MTTELSKTITVVTSVTDSKDSLEWLNNMPISEDSTYVGYMDEPQFIEGMEIKPAYNKFKDNRRNSRIHKILIHQYVNTPYSIWLDGNIRLLVPPNELVEKHLKNHDIAVWKHPNRDCIYDESIKCAQRGLDDTETIIEQAVKYEKAGYGKNKGLCECGMILRRNTKQVEEFNNAWWSEYCRHSCRDQISFMYVADRLGMRVNMIYDPFIVIKDTDKAVRESGVAEIYPHKKLNK